MPKKKRIAKPHPTTAYAKAVVAGKITMGLLVRLACQRHLDDLKDGKKRGLYFDKKAASYAIKFFLFLVHIKGEWAGRPIVLDPWECFIIGSLFGWKRADGFRRFRTAYNELARKNGKSTMAAGAGLLLLVADNEPGAEVYSAATKRDQAKIVFDLAKTMVRRSPFLSKRINVQNLKLEIEATDSKFEPLSSDAKKQDGLNPHGAILDEVQAYANRDLVDVIETGTAARRQPLTIEITTAGNNQQSVCFEHHEYSIRVLKGIVVDDTWFAFIATIDEGDDWRDPKVWCKANPGLGQQVKLDDLQRKCAKAIESPSAQNTFRTKHINEWTQQSERWIDLNVWDEGNGAVDEKKLRHRECYAGLDLARVNDLSALALLFPPVEKAEPWKLLLRFWCPEDDIQTRSKEHRVPYQVWTDQGFIEPTPGNTTDFNFIEAAILEEATRFQILEVAYDRLFAGEIVNNLIDEGMTMVPFGQGFYSLGAPAAEFERLIIARKLIHGGNPIMRWNVDNVVKRVDPAGLIKPDKEKSREKIDGVAATINALGRAMVAPKPRQSVYNKRGVVSV